MDVLVDTEGWHRGWFERQRKSDPYAGFDTEKVIFYWKILVVELLDERIRNQQEVDVHP